MILTQHFAFATQSVSLAWDPSPDTNVIGYKVYYGVVSRTYTNIVDAGNTTNVTISGLVEGVTYYFAATAYNVLGMESVFSTEVSYSVPSTGNQPPTLNALSDLTINEKAGQQTVNLSGISSGSTNEIQTLRVTAASSNTGLIPNPTVHYTSPNATGTLTFTPVANASGLATVTVTVNDGGASNNIVTRTFTVTVNAPPTISAIPLQTVATNTSAGPISFTIGDKEIPAANLALWANSSVPTLISTNRIIFGGSGSNRTVTLTPLPNQSGYADITITVSDGNATASTTFQLSVLSSPMPPGNFMIITNGSGSVTPNLKSQSLTMGKTYTVTAVPAAGQIFAGWSGSYPSPSPKLTFLMTSNLVLQANFVPSPFIPVAGTYSGLFYENDEVRLFRSGFFNISASTKGTYSGYLQLGAKRYSISGSLDPQCRATKVIVRKNDSPLTVNLQIGSTNEIDHIFGQITNDTWVATLLGDRAVFNSKTNPAPYAGKFTMLIPGQVDDLPIPAGNGFGTVSVDSKGAIRFAGTLADGTKVSQSVALSKNGLWPLYVPLYSGNGSVLSWLAFTNQASNDFNGLLSWIKSPDVKAKYYPNGFTNDYATVGSAYAAPVNTNILNLTTAQLVFSGGNLDSSFTNLLTLGSNSKVTSNSNRLSMSFSLSSGTYRGSVTAPGGTKSWSFSGAVLEKMNAGYGLLLGTNQSSAVVFAP